MARDISAGSNLTAANTAVNFTGNMTVSLFCNLDVLTGWLFTRMHGFPTNSFGFGVYVNGATSYGAFIGDGGSSGTHVNSGAGAVSPRLGVWDHVVMRLTGTTLEMHVNGKPTISGSVGALVPTSTALVFGDWWTGSNTIDGRLAEVAVWNISLSRDDIFALYQGVPASQIGVGNLRGYWPLNSGGPIELDYSPFQNHATSNNARAAEHPSMGQLIELLGVFESVPGENEDIGTVELRMRPSTADVAVINDAATILFDLQPSSTEIYARSDAATVLVDLRVLGGECYSTYSAQLLGEGEADLRWMESDLLERWNDDDDLRWSEGDVSLGEGIHC